MARFFELGEKFSGKFKDFEKSRYGRQNFLPTNSKMWVCCLTQCCVEQKFWITEFFQFSLSNLPSIF